MNLKLNEAMDHISDAFIADAAAQINQARGAAVPPNPRPHPWLGAVAAVLVIALIGAFLFPVLNALDTTNPTNPTVLQSPTTVGSTTGTTRPTTSTTRPTTGDPTSSSQTQPTTQGTTPTTKRPTEPSTTAISLSTNKSIYTIDENIFFTITSPSQTNRLTLERVDGQWMQTYDNVGTSYILAFGWDGEYKAKVETQYGTATLTSPTIYFTVNKASDGSAPTYAHLYTDKVRYSLGDTVKFSMYTDGETNTIWVYAPDGTSEYFENAGSTFSYIPKQDGMYYALVETYIGTNRRPSPRINFQVFGPNYNPCINGHTFQNGFCINCAIADPNYDPCADGHTFENGYCIYCSKEDDPCADGHWYDENGFCIYCNATDPCANGHQYQNGTCLICNSVDPCANGHWYEKGVCIYCNHTAPYYDSVDTPDLLEEHGATLKIMIPGHNPKDTYAWQNHVVQEFKYRYYGVTVNFVTATWNDWYEKLMAAYVSGDPIDLLYDTVNNQPKLAITGVTQPLQNYINMDNPNLEMEAMDECFKYGGNYYVAASEVNYGVIFYNKDMFAAAGLDDPMDLYKNGQWNWTNFTALAKALTDKDAGIYGFATEFPFLFYGANATSTLKLDANGNYSLNMDDPAFIAALEIIQDGEYKSGWSGFEIYAMNSFQIGEAAMLGSFTMYESEINQLNVLFGWEPINYGVVPMPYGPNNTQKRNMVHASGWSIGAGSDCPYHVGKLIDMLVDGNAAYLAKEQSKLPAASRELYAEMADNVFCVNTRDSAINGGYELPQVVGDGKSIAQAIEEFKPQYQAMINQYTTND